MASIKSYRDLIAWQKALALAKSVYDIMKSFPSDEKLGLTSQMRRVAVSVAANIAEGQARNTSGEFRQALGIARGSLAELETMLILAEQLGLLATEKMAATLSMCDEVSKLLAGLMRSLSSRTR